MENKDPSKSVGKNIHGKEYQCDSSQSSLSSKKLKNTDSVVGPKLLKNSSSSEKSGLVKQRGKSPNQINEELKKAAQSSNISEKGGSKNPREKLPNRENEELKKTKAVHVSDGRKEELKMLEAVQPSDGRSIDLKKLEAVKVGDGTMSDDTMHEGDAKYKSNADKEAKPTMSDFDLNVFPPNWDHDFI